MTHEFNDSRRLDKETSALTATEHGPTMKLRPATRKETTMGKVLKCGDVVPGCNAEITGDSEHDVLRKAAEHAKTAHNMESFRLRCYRK
jgi:predicted small metal-binding protein